jgi:hypothetical protein
MSQRPLLFAVMAVCLSTIVLVWSQSRLPDENRQDAAAALSSKPHGPWRVIFPRWRELSAFPRVRLAGAGVLSGIFGIAAF